MKTQGWFQKESPNRKRATAVGRPVDAPSIRSKSGKAADIGTIAARLRPHELIAMLTHHYTRVRARSMPRVKTSLSVNTPSGKAAVTISFG